MSKDEQLKKGDKVICIDPKGKLIKDKEYIIYKNDGEYVHIDDTKDGYFSNRFKLVKEEKVEKKGKKSMSKTHVAEVVRHGEKLLIPPGMGIPEAIDILERQAKYEEEQIEIKEDINCFIWDGALAMSKAMKQKFGWASAEIIPGSFFTPSQKPQMISVEISYNETVLVPWGRFTLPNIEGYVETGWNNKDGRVIFQFHAVVKRKHESAIRELIAIARDIASKESIYKGKAIRIRFNNDDGEALSWPIPKFLDISRVKENELIFSDEVQSAVSTSIFTVVEHTEKCRKHKIPLKRGVLLSGPYGTGKTLVAYVTAKKCVDNAWTYLYCERADELGEMVRFAKHYEPAVIFCEDIDREVAGERSVQMDEILNIVDGIESKNSELMIILTTNHIENINKAMLRPGRLDAVINVLPPDAKAVEKLIRLYGGFAIAPEEDLKEASEILKGQIPAVVRECVERSKLSAIRHCKDESTEMKITGGALLEASRTMKMQLDLLAKEKPNLTLNEKLGLTFRELIQETMIPETEKVLSRIGDLE